MLDEFLFCAILPYPFHSNLLHSFLLLLPRWNFNSGCPVFLSLSLALSFQRFESMMMQSFDIASSNEFKWVQSVFTSILNTNKGKNNKKISCIHPPTQEIERARNIHTHRQRKKEREREKEAAVRTVTHLILNAAQDCSLHCICQCAHCAPA